MRKQIISIAVVFCLIVGMFTACGKNTGKSAQAEMQLKWTETWIPQYSKSDGSTKMPKSVFFKNTIFDKTEYLFEKESFKENKAKNFIKRETKLIAYADKVLKNKRDGEKIYLNAMVAGKIIRTNEPITFDTLWMALNRIYKVSSLEAYGLFYLYSMENNLMELKEKTTIRDKELAHFFLKKENRMFLDFTVPMIDNKIFEQEQVDMTKAAAKSFAKWYVEQYPLREYEKMCGNIEFYNREKLEAEKNAWLKSIGVNVKYKEFAKVFIKTSDYVYRDKRIGEQPADYEIVKPDVVWIFYNQDIKNNSYCDTISKYNTLESLRKKDFAEARKFLKVYIPEKVDKVKLLLDFHNDEGTMYAMYIHSIGDIKLSNGWDAAAYSLLHEYIHFLTRQPGGFLRDSDSDFCVEGIAVWISELQLENREYDLWRRQKVKESKKKFLKMGKEYRLYDAYCDCVKEQISRDYNRKAPKGVPYPVDIESMFAYCENGVILKYIYETYGMEKTMELLKSGADFEKVLGKSLDYIYFEAADFAKKEMKRIEAERGKTK